MDEDKQQKINPDGPTPDLVSQLARYLRANPLAGDTKEGITQWWLGLQPVFVDAVEEALEALEQAGVIVAKRAADGHVRYRRVSPDADVDARLDHLIATPNFRPKPAR